MLIASPESIADLSVVSVEANTTQQHFVNISRGMRRDLLKAIFRNVPVSYDVLYVGLYVNSLVEAKMWLPTQIPLLSDEYPGYVMHEFTWPTPIIVSKKIMTSDDWEVREDRVGNVVAFNKDDLVFGDGDNPFGAVTQVHGALISIDPSGSDIIMSVPFDAPSCPTVSPGVALYVPRGAIMIRFDSANPEKFSYVASDYSDTTNIGDWYG